MCHSSMLDFNRLDRRSFIRAGAAGVLAASPLRLLANEEYDIVVRRPKLGADPFTLGIASGDPDSQGFVIWTRLAPQPTEGGGMPNEAVAVAWEVSEDEAFEKVVRKGETPALPQLGHSVHVELDGLKPDRWYWYRFHVADETSPVGRGRTMPKPGAEPDELRFAFASCQHYETGLYTAHDHLSQEDIDLAFHLGDYIYEYAGVDGRVRKHVGGEIESLDDYRNRYGQYKSDPHLMAAHAICPWVVTWDDHEFDNNYANLVSEEEGVDPAKFLARRANAYQAYYEHMPLRKSCMPTGPDMRLYRRVRFGRLADFNVLDTRQYRTDQPNGDKLKALRGDVFDPAGTLLGRRQEGWLCRGLISSPCRWNVLAQQVMMARVDFAPGAAGLFSMDMWPGYDVARKRLLSFLASRQVSNPVVLTGDIHSNWCNDLLVDFDDQEAKPVATEFVCTSMSSEGDGADNHRHIESVLAENPFVKFQNSQRGYVRCMVTPSEWRADYRVVSYVTRPGAAVETKASFVVEHGRPGATPA